MHQLMAATLDNGRRRNPADSGPRAAEAAANSRETPSPRWPMIVLRTPKGWTGPKDVDGLPVEGTLPGAPGADGRHGQARARQNPGNLDEELPAGGTVRRGGQAQAGAGRVGAAGPAPHERQSARQRRAAAVRPADARFPTTTPSTCPSRGRSTPRPPRPRRSSSAT